MSSWVLAKLEKNLARTVDETQRARLERLIAEQRRQLGGVEPPTVRQNTTLDEATSDGELVRGWTNYVERVSRRILANDQLFTARCTTRDRQEAARQSAAYRRAVEERARILWSVSETATVSQLQTAFDAFNDNEQLLERTLITLCSEPLPVWAAQTRAVVISERPLLEDAESDIADEIELTERWLDTRRLSRATRFYETMVPLLRMAMRVARFVQERNVFTMPFARHLSTQCYMFAATTDWIAFLTLGCVVALGLATVIYEAADLFDWPFGLADVMRQLAEPLNLERYTTAMLDGRAPDVRPTAQAVAVIFSQAVVYSMTRPYLETYERWNLASRGFQRMLIFGVVVSTGFSVMLQNRIPSDAAGRSMVVLNRQAVAVGDAFTAVQVQNIAEAAKAAGQGDFQRAAEQVGDWWANGGRFSLQSPLVVEFEPPPNARERQQLSGEQRRLAASPAEFAAVAVANMSDAALVEFGDVFSRAACVAVLPQHFNRNDGAVPAVQRVGEMTRINSASKNAFLNMRDAAQNGVALEQSVVDVTRNTFGETAATVVDSMPTAVKRSLLTAWLYAQSNAVSTTSYAFEVATKSVPAAFAVGAMATKGAVVVAGAVAGVPFLAPIAAGTGLVVALRIAGEDDLPSDERVERYKVIADSLDDGAPATQNVFV